MEISIIGSGVVGQATGIGLSANGNKVVFYDINKDKLENLKNNGYDVVDDLEEAVLNSNVIFVCVPTPTINEKIDLSHIQECTRNIGDTLRKSKNFHVIVFRSTIPPQTTRTKLVPSLEICSRLTAGKDFGICTNPEFLREKTPLEDFLKPNRIVIGELNQESGDTLEKIYEPFNAPIIRTDLDTAEMIKYTSNIYLAAKISFFNEIYLICQRLGIDPRIVSDTVSLDPRIGAYGVIGGKPFGGMCLPKDLSAFIEFANSKGINSSLLRAVAAVNREMSSYCSVSQELQMSGGKIASISSN